jgi:hypothetical protein
MRECGGGLQLAYITDSFEKEKGEAEGDRESLKTERKKEEGKKS